jgi:hypothetical protein
MKPELQKKLFEKYPEIFTQKDWGKDKTCMCWGIETGDGWYFLIDSLCAAIQQRIKNEGLNQAEFCQVKEKFGELRIYHDSCDSGIEAMVEFAGQLSYHICEDCGSTEGVTQTKGYVTSLCKKCIKTRVDLSDAIEEHNEKVKKGKILGK